MTEQEIKAIDSKAEQMLDWAKTRTAEAEQLALDSARLLSCTGERMNQLAGQGFFKRCWSRFTGEAGGMERANINDLIQMQKMGYRYINMLEERNLLMAHSMLSLKNNLYSLQIKEVETRNLVDRLAQRTLERFEKLESRVEQLEISTNLNHWVTTLEEREYDVRIPAENMRMLQVINDFYAFKNDAWNYQDLLSMRAAIRKVGLEPKKKISLNNFIDTLTEEILREDVGFDKYQYAITKFQPEGLDDYSKYAIEEISSPIFSTLHGVKINYCDRRDFVNDMLEMDGVDIAEDKALKHILKKTIKRQNIKLDYEFSLAETAFEILGCLRLANILLKSDANNEEKVSFSENIDEIITNKTDKEKNETNNNQNKNLTNNEIEANEEFDVEASFSMCFFQKILDEDKSYYLKGHSRNYFPMKKIQNAIKEYAHFEDIDDIIAYYDDTLFGSGTDGFCATKSVFYYKECLEDGNSFNFKDIKSVDMEDDKIAVTTKNGFKHKFKFATIDNDSLRRVFSFAQIHYFEFNHIEIN
jgi:hypothetical protein